MTLRSQYLDSFLIAADDAPAFRVVFELCIAVAVIMVITGYYAAIGSEYVGKTALAEAFNLSSTMRVDMIAFRAQHGRWPPRSAELASAQPTDPALGGSVARVELGADGAFTYVFRNAPSTGADLANRRLTLRPGTVAGIGGAPVSWYCARGAAPAGIAITGVDETDLPDELLLSICRVR